MASRPKTTGVGRRVARVSQGVRTGQTSEVTQRASAVDIVSALSSPPLPSQQDPQESAK